MIEESVGREVGLELEVGADVMDCVYFDAQLVVTAVRNERIAMEEVADFAVQQPSRSVFGADVVVTVVLLLLDAFGVAVRR